MAELINSFKIACCLKEKTSEEIFIIGGAEIYAQTISLADTLYLTEVAQTIAGDAFFPKIDKSKWREVAREPHAGFAFVTYQKVLSQ